MVRGRTGDNDDSVTNAPGPPALSKQSSYKEGKVGRCPTDAPSAENMRPKFCVLITRIKNFQKAKKRVEKEGSNKPKKNRWTQL